MSVNDPDRNIVIDASRSVSLGNQGSRFTAATLVAADGAEYMILVDPLRMGETVYDAACSSVYHEQVGPLPLGLARRIKMGPGDAQ